MSIPFLVLQSAVGTPPEAPIWMTAFPFVAMGVIFWFLILRPQMRQQKDQRTKIAGIKKGDQVLTGGGLVAKVLRVDGDYADLELGTNMKVKALKSTIVDVIPPVGSKPAND